MQKKKVIGFILMLIAILTISFGGKSAYAAETPKIMERESGTYVTGTGEVFYAIGAKRAGKTKYTADLISSITLVTNKNVPANAEASWDVSYTSGSNEVIAWVVQNSTDTTKYDLYIGSSSSNIEAPSESHGLFRNYTNCVNINNLKILTTQNITDAGYMFFLCNALTSLDLQNFVTTNITQMNLMFSYCTSLVNLDLSGFNTSKVVNMRSMFDGSKNLTSLDLSNFDTRNVTDIAIMFYGCNNLESVNLSSFDTTKVTDMYRMFYFCTSLKNLDLSNFRTPSATNMGNMFFYCSSLTSLDVSNFDTTNVTNMEKMFSYCSKLTSLDLSNFKTPNVTNMTEMFYNCNSLTSLDVSNFDTKNISDMSGMFYFCTSLKNLDLSNFRTPSATNMGNMFFYCSSLTSLDVSNFDTTNVTNMEKMFSYCRKLTSLNISNFDTPNVTNMTEMFYNCNSLTSIDVSNFDTTNVTNMENMFYNCSNLKAIILDKAITSSNQAMKLLTNTTLDVLPNAILYVPDTASEKLYEAATNYSTVFADSRDANGDLYRIRPILEVAGDNPAKVSLNGIYDETKDAGATIAGFDKANASEYTQYGYNYEVTGLPVDTTTTGIKQITYKLTKNKNGITTDGMTAVRNVRVGSIPKLMIREDYEYVSGKGNVYYAIGAGRSGNKKYTADLISTITFVTNKNVPSTAEASWDVSFTNGDNEVIAWVIQNAEDTTKYDLFIGADATTIDAPVNSNRLLGIYANCTAINNLTMLNISKVTNIDAMFSSCSKLTSLDLSNFNTSKVTSMHDTFSFCESLTSLDVTNFDTSNVTDMEQMFAGCKQLTKLDVTNFNTSKVTTMSTMFATCSNLTVLDVTNFDTSNVTSMMNMFMSCRNLTSIDLSNFNTSKVTRLGSMFNSCESLTSIDLSNFDTSSVTGMSYMFTGCNKLTSIDLNNFDTRKVTGMYMMFGHCKELKVLNISNFDTTNVTNMENMFYNCSNLKAIILDKAITSSNQAMKLLTNTTLDVLPNAILYVPDTASEKLYEAATNYSTVFADSRDTNGDLYRIRPILEVAGDNPAKVSLNGIYDETKDAGTTIAGFDKANASEYTQYGYNYEVAGLPVDTTTKGTKQVTYTLTKTENGATTNGMTATRDIKVLGVPMLMEREGYDYIDSKSVYYAIGAKRSGNTKYTADLISTITFVNNTNIPSTAEASWDASYTSGDGEVIAWVIPNATDNTKFDLYIGADDTRIQAPVSSGYLFGNYENCTAINSLSMLDTSKVTAMNYMFSGCKVLTSLDVSTFDTSKVTNMMNMFYFCNALTNLNVSNFNTSNVTDTRSMFEYCRSLISLDVSNFNTSNVTNMNYMFFNCKVLTSLDVSNFDTSKVTDMSGMFNGCSSLTSLNLVTFDTSNVTSMNCMFWNCRSLTNIEVTNFDTSKVTDMGHMFGDCRSLTSLDVSNFDTSKVTDMSCMFYVCRGLTDLNISNFDTSNVTKMNSMLFACGSLTNIDVSNFDTSKVTDMSCMFSGCKVLTSLDVGNFDTSKVTDMRSMFNECSSLTSLNLCTFDTSKVTDMRSMFNGCSSLTSLDLRSFDTSSLDGKTYFSGGTVLGVDVNYMFYNCSNLKSIIFGDKFNRFDGYDMFGGCSNLKAIITTKEITSSSEAPILRTENVTNTNGKTIAGPNGLINIPNAILYVPSTTSEVAYGSATNYDTVLGADRIRPILGVAGDNPAKVKVGGTYDSSVDAGATIAGFGVTDSGEYTQYGYNYTTAGLPLDTSAVGTKQVTYTLRKTENGTTTNGMTTTRTVNIVGLPKLMERDSEYISGKGILYYYAIGAVRSGNKKYTSDLITSITFVTNKNVPSTAEASWDVSYTNGNNEVIAWVIQNAEDSTKYDLYIGADDTKIQAPANSTNLFERYENCTAINNLSMLDTSNVTNMSGMFFSCSALTSLDVSNFDTSKVTTMADMFHYCINLTSLDLNNFDTTKVTDMNLMFWVCRKLTNLDVSNFNTSNVTDMNHMFYYCSSLTNLDVSNFDTSKVTDMSYMFALCSGLTSLDVTNFNTSKVTTMLNTFNDCSSLTSLDVSNFNTSNVTDMKEMFADCSSLTSLDLSNFNTSKVTTMMRMFSNCFNLTDLNISSFNTSNVTDMSLMFASCRSLTNLDLSNFNTSNVTNMSVMFSTCRSLESLNLAHFDTRNAKTIGFMFYNCTSLKNLIVTGTNFTFTKLDHTTAGIYPGEYEAVDINGVFEKCSSLTSLDLSSWNITASENMNELFAGCTKLRSVVLGKNFAALKGADMFKNCDNLRAIITKRTTPLTLVTGTGAETVGVNNPKVLYVETKQLESSFESASNYASVFGADRIRPILGVAGDNPAKVKVGGTYDSSVDAGATIAGFTKAESSEYTQYGYNYTTAGLPLNTSAIGTKQVTYTLRKTENGTTTNGMTATRTVEIIAVDITGSVSISGDCTYGETLIVDTSKINPEEADFEYKWYINDNNSTTGGTLIHEGQSSNGTGDQCFISGDAVGKYIYVEVIATAPNYVTKTFTDLVGPVKRASINIVEAYLLQEVMVYDGNPKEPQVVVTDLRTIGDLTLGKDYTLEYKDNINPGNGKVIVKGINNYTGERELTFKIIATPKFKLVNLTPDWTTSNVSIAINILDSGAGISKVLFEKVGVTLQNNSATVTVDKNGLYAAEVFDIYENVVVEEIYIGNIDRDAPVIEEVKYDGTSFAKVVRVDVKAVDTGSGVYAYAVSENDAEPTTWTNVTPVENMKIFDFTISQNGSYYLFVKDAVGNITKYDKQIVINNIDNAPPVIKLFDITDDYTFTTQVFIEIKAEDDTGVESILLSNEILTNSQVENADNWIPYTETILYTLPSKDGNHTVYAWVKDTVGKISEYAQDSTLLLNKYVGSNGINSTSFKFLVKDENYDFAKKITESNIKIFVKDDSNKVTYSTEYGVNITSISLPVVYGPVQEGTRMMTGEYYTITVENIGGEGTVYLVFDENSVVDKAGNKLADTEIETDVEVELNAPTITLGATEIQVSDSDGNLIQAIKVNGKTVLLTGGKITYEKLKSEYGITLKTDDTIEAFDKHSNSVMITVQ